MPARHTSVLPDPASVRDRNPKNDHNITQALVAYAFLAVTTALERGSSGSDNDQVQLIPLTCPELLLLRLLFLPPPRCDIDTSCTGPPGAGHHQYRARTCHLAWHAYADTTP
ncbi:hypothetical protein [Streptomyces avermitilis]|uniref:hypothetical protein n=1 Tax=Streptomyces avermitilis TaxID=33903 RepID=UPI0037F94073